MFFCAALGVQVPPALGSKAHLWHNCIQLERVGRTLPFPPVCRAGSVRSWERPST